MLPPEGIVVLALGGLMLGIFAWGVLREDRGGARGNYKSAEDQFARTYPDLLPDLHPSKVLAFTLRQYGRAIDAPDLASRSDVYFRKTPRGARLSVGKHRFEIFLYTPDCLQVDYWDERRGFSWTRTLADGDYWRFDTR